MAGLYIHIPFCAQKCAYCDFFSRRHSADTVARMVDALKREMSSRRSRIADSDFISRSQLSTSGFPLSTIYLGGGTPSLLSPAQLQGLLDHAAGLWDCSGVGEITVEANPEDLTDEYLARLAETAVNRLSIGIQSFDDGLLRLMNRRHNASRAKQAVKAAQKAGFDNITIDLIFGVSTMTQQVWERTLDEAVNLGVRHISAYHLTIEPGTHFGRMMQKGTLSTIPEPESERQFETLRRKLADADFEHYEISNFAQSGYRAIHNSAYWTGEPYLGIGPSAHSFDGARRREWVASDITKYLSEAGTDKIYDGETLSDVDLFNERVMTSLRTAEGLNIEEVKLRFGADRTTALGRRAGKDGNIAIMPEKFLLSDYIISSLFET